MTSSAVPSKASLRRDDILLLGIMAALAGCGLVYEYLLSAYAARVLGAVETTIYAMIGIMIVSMGAGAFAAKWIKRPYDGFVRLEVLVAIIGCSSVIVLAAVVAFTHLLPYWIERIYGLPVSIVRDGGVLATLQNIAFYLPYPVGALLGMLIGMEIPLIARVREDVHGQHLTHNAGTIYGADYIGAGIGAALWVFFCIQMPLIYTAVITASVNVIAGLVFMLRFWNRIGSKMLIIAAHLLLLGLLALLALFGPSWMDGLKDTLFKDKVVYSKNTSYQHLAITERKVGSSMPSIIGLNLNGRLQFNSNDEAVYHSMLVYPALATSARVDKVLVIGGGDGLAVRNILRWNPQSVTLLDLDASVIDLFSGRDEDAPQWLTKRLRQLNQDAFNDPRVSIELGDAFLTIDTLLRDNRHFDAIIVDLPDPSHPNLNKLYSRFFYAKLNQLLSGDGVISIQSTSPFHAPEAFLSIGNTLRAAGFSIERYRQNVPSFGEWGWTVGVKHGRLPSQRLADLTAMPVADEWVTLAIMRGAFALPEKLINMADGIDINTLGSNLTYQLHEKAWSKRDGAFNLAMPNTPKEKM